MRAIQITELTGPETALRKADVDEPRTDHFLTPGEGVVIDVEATGVSFPELLQTRGLYQMKPDVPFIPGSEVAGVVRSAPDGAAVKAGDRVAALCVIGGWAQVAVAPAHLTFPLPEPLDWAQGAALVLNYHTAYFCLVTRGRVADGDWVLVHGAAGGVGTATLQVARALGARTIGVVSSDEKAELVQSLGADAVLRSDGPWKDEAREVSGGGVHVVIDPVGGDRFTDSLRSLRRFGRVVVVGFTGGSIPEVKVNRLLLGNTEVVGAGWGEAALGDPALCAEIGARLHEMIEAGVIAPPIGTRLPLERAAEALLQLEARGAMGKIVLEL